MVSDILHRLSGQRFITINADELKMLLENADEVKETDAGLGGTIRLLRFGNDLYIQEETDKKELLLRGIESEQAADDFIRDRLETYERMWDGCGCKVHYYD